MGDARQNATDAADRSISTAGKDQISAPQAEVQNYLRTSGNLSRSTASDASVHALFGTPTIDIGDCGSVYGDMTNQTSEPSTPQTQGFAPRSWGQAALDTARGVGELAGAALVGAGQSVEQVVDRVHQAGSATAAAISAAVPGTPGAIESAATGIGHAAIAMATHPIDSTATAAKAVGEALASSGETALHGAGAVVQAVEDHPVQAAAIALAVGVEVASVGTATPLATALAVAGGIGAGVTVHDTANAITSVAHDAHAIAPMFHGNQVTAEQMNDARAVVAKDIGSAAADGLAMGVGLGIGKLATGAESAAASTGHSTALAHAGEAGAAVADFEPLANGSAQAGVRLAQAAQDTFNHASSMNTITTAVGGSGGPPSSMADERARHAQFAPGALPPS